MGCLANQTVLPTISFSEQNLEVGSSSWLSTSKDVVAALEEFGCFNATYSNFSPQLHHAIFGASEELFDLPTHVKMLNTSDTPTHGYVGQIAAIPLYEGLGIENATTQDGVTKFTHLLWPSGNETFRETALEYSKVVAELDKVVMRMVAEVYGIRSAYESLVETTSYLLKLIKYRPPAKDEAGLGIVPHTDKSFTSILHQRLVKGLQIMTKAGDWIGVDPSPSAFVFMAGDACMAFTNGRIEPSKHRVIIDGSEERYSLGLFTFIRDVKIQVPEELVDEDHPLQFKPFDHYKFIHFIYTEESKSSESPIRAFCGV
ncbi:probable 2-oxoglutarate-dependent dioxygenase AOP1 [Salvia miltiorrhiza]|uniref:probable 2-oxoglutarate-dependent dioxygenase AOP1 n=1 Tax=Salvia miltiorrhiza TaxID=226208 RepID=UPI0025AD422D|nr:probable 2-oxoglutarate-dependent dioxygenase AOP1 [Salvia miltiorrhiza]